MRWVGLRRCQRELISRRGWDHVVRESSRFITICLIRTNKCWAAAEALCSKSPDKTPRLLFALWFYLCVFALSVFFAATQTRQPGEPDRGVPPQTEAPPGVWVLRPHGAHRAGPPPQGVSCVLLSNVSCADVSWSSLTINTQCLGRSCWLDELPVEIRQSSGGSESFLGGLLTD